MRPTIPLSRWRIALDLDATADLHRLARPPAYNCPCEWCRNWHLAAKVVLPIDISDQLRRVGVDLLAPSDLYPHSAGEKTVAYRITYHCVGRILEGPSLFREDPVIGRVRHYEELRASPAWLGLSVAYEADLASVPPWAPAGVEPLVQVDFRAEVPWLLKEQQPSVAVPPSVKERSPS